MKVFPILISGISLLSWFSLAEEAERTCRIVFPNRPNEAPGFAFVSDGVSSRKVRLSSMNFSEVIPVSRDATTITLTAGEIVPPDRIPREAPSVLLPEKAKDFYLILSYDKEGPQVPVSMRLVNITGRDWNPGETLWINTSEYAIEATLGEVDITVGADDEVISNRPILESGYYTASLRFQSVDGNPGRPITEQHWWHDANCRYLAFLAGGKGVLPKILLYRDFRPSEAGK